MLPSTAAHYFTGTSPFGLRSRKRDASHYLPHFRFPELSSRSTGRDQSNLVPFNAVFFRCLQCASLYVGHILLFLMLQRPMIRLYRKVLKHMGHHGFFSDHYISKRVTCFSRTELQCNACVSKVRFCDCANKCAT